MNRKRKRGVCLFRDIVLFQGSVASVSLVYYCASNSDFESIQKSCQTRG